MNHFPSINAISASICLLGCGLALPVFSQQPEKGKPDAAHISKTKADWWSQRHALLKPTAKKYGPNIFPPMLLSISG